MSYDIDFIKSNKISAENVDEYLQTEASDTDHHFISKELMNEIKVDLADRGLRFETFEGQEYDYLELNFETYQICMFNSQIAVSLAYGNVNSKSAIEKEIELISKVLIDKGFTGYDPQTGEFFSAKKAFATDFVSVNKRVSEHFSPTVSSEKKSEVWRLLKLGLFFVLAAFLIRLLFSLVGKFF